MRRVAVTAVLLALVAVPVLAQNGQANTNSASAVLHLRATVVPVAYSVLPPAPQTNGAVWYTMPTPRTFVDVTQQVRALAVAEGGSKSVSIGVLKTTVVLAQ